MNRFLTRRIAIAIGLVLIVIACGKKMLPRPPSEVAPRPVTDLSARLTEKAVMLTWKAPRMRKDGSPLYRLSGFRVLRASYKRAENCPGCPIRYTDIFEIPEPGLQKEIAGGDRIQFTDTKVTYRHKYVYTVQAIDEDGRVGEKAEPITVYWDVPPGPPRDLSAQAGDGWVRLSWKAPEKLLDGSIVEGPLAYYIYRRRGEDSYKRLMEAGPLSDTRFTDTSVDNDVLYTYQVRAVRAVRPTLIEGIKGPEVTVFPRDTTPPASPRGLSAIASPEGVILRWVDNKEADLAGYIVYRRKNKEKEWQRLSQKMAKSPRYMDREVRKGEVYYYTVTAVDSSPQQNESKMPFAVRVLVE